MSNPDLSAIVAEQKRLIAKLQKRELASQSPLRGKKQIMLFSYDARSLPTTPHPGLALVDSSLNFFEWTKDREAWLKSEKLKLQKSNRQALLFWIVTKSPEKELRNIIEAAKVLPIHQNYVRDCGLLRCDDLATIRAWYHDLLSMAPRVRSDRMPYPWDRKSPHEKLAAKLRQKLCRHGVNPDQQGAA